MSRRWAFIFGVLPITFLIVLAVNVLIRYGMVYEVNWFEIPFTFFHIAVGIGIGYASLFFIHKITTQSNRSLIAEFLARQKLEIIFNSDLLTGLYQASRPIEEVKRLTGGYSGAQVYSIRRKGVHIPFVLKVAEGEEIDNEFEKFNKYVADQLAISPASAEKYPPWGDQYKGLKYALNWAQAGADHLTFSELYREFLEMNFPLEAVVQATGEVIDRLFAEIRNSGWRWDQDTLRRENQRRINLYQEHYTFALKIDDRIFPIIAYYEKWAEGHTSLNNALWTNQAFGSHLRLGEWKGRLNDPEYNCNIVRTIIHGDLNSRNILLEVSPDNHLQILTIGLIDFSHTGNGLTKTRYNKAAEDIKRIVESDHIDLSQDKASIAKDFCRLEAEIKFYVTGLDDEQDLRRAWILEAYYLEQGLTLPHIIDLSAEEFVRISGEVLTKYKLNQDPMWLDLTNAKSWEQNHIRKFVLMWECVKSIRHNLLVTLPNGLQEIEPFYMALLQATLSMIYYENERFHNADLQKLYMVLAASLLCKNLPAARPATLES